MDLGSSDFKAHADVAGCTECRSPWWCSRAAFLVGLMRPGHVMTRCTPSVLQWTLVRADLAGHKLPSSCPRWDLQRLSRTSSHALAHPLWPGMSIFVQMSSLTDTRPLRKDPRVDRVYDKRWQVKRLIDGSDRNPVTYVGWHVTVQSQCPRPRLVKRQLSGNRCLCCCRQLLRSRRT